MADLIIICIVVVLALGVLWYISGEPGFLMKLQDMEDDESEVEETEDTAEAEQTNELEG